MTLREKVLEEQMEEWDEKTAALDLKITALTAVITEFKQLPRALGQQTSQYNAAGVRESIKDDFSLPLGQAMDGPIARFAYATDRAAGVINEIRNESKFQSWSLVVLLGIAMGVTGNYFYYTRQLGQINDWLDSLQQQMVPAAPVVDVKPTDPNPAKAHKAHGAVAQPNP